MTLGTKSVIKITIEWAAGTQIYADEENIVPAWRNSILSFDVVTAQRIAAGGGDVSSVSVVLDDNPAFTPSLKTLYNTETIEGIACTVEQVFTGGVTKTITILKGTISGDIVWSEGERTLSFSIDSDAVDQIIGYAPEEGDFVGLHPDAIGIPWPICFGTVLRVPAIRVTKPYDLTLEHEVTVSDSTYTITNGNTLPQGTPIDLSISEILFTGTMSGDVFTPTAKNKAKYISVAIAARITSDEDFGNPSVLWLSGSENIARHYCIINHATLGWTVNHCLRQVGKKCWFAKPWDGQTTMDASSVISTVARYPQTGWLATFEILSGGENTILKLALDGWRIYKDAKVVYNPGTVTNRYVCNLVASTEILEVWAYRTFKGKKILAQVPSSYYTKQLSLSLAGHTITAIDMNQSLSDIFCENWEDDDLFVSLRSSLGSHTSDAISWILTNYSSLSIDATSFAATKVSLTNYPSHFAIFDQPRAFDVCREIAWQARSAVVSQGGTAYLLYLADNTYAVTLDESLTEFKSMSLGFLSKDELITRLKATWYRDYAKDDKDADGSISLKTYIYDNNISAYGLTEMDKEFWIYNIEDNVKASVNFWGYRLSNLWRTFASKSFIDISLVVPFETVRFDYTTLGFSGVVRAQLSYVGHNTDEPIIELQGLIASKAGAMTEDANFFTVGAGDTTDPGAGLAEVDYDVESDGTCDYSVIVHSPIPQYRIVITFIPPVIRWGIQFWMAAEIWDGDDNIVSINIAAKVELHASDRWAVQVLQNINFTAGKWDGNLTIIGGAKNAMTHLWIKSLSLEVYSSRTQIGAE